MVCEFVYFLGITLYTLEVYCTPLGVVEVIKLYVQCLSFLCRCRFISSGGRIPSFPPERTLDFITGLSKEVPAFKLSYMEG